MAPFLAFFVCFSGSISMVRVSELYSEDCFVFCKVSLFLIVVSVILFQTFFLVFLCLGGLCFYLVFIFQESLVVLISIKFTCRILGNDWFFFTMFGEYLLQCSAFFFVKLPGVHPNRHRIQDCLNI